LKHVFPKSPKEIDAGGKRTVWESWLWPLRLERWKRKQLSTSDGCR
jgi:hypothetical protein